MQRTREEIVAAHEAVTGRMEALVARLTEADLAKTVYPGWTVKDLLCHLSSGSAAGAFFIGLARSGRSGTDPGFDLDKWNRDRVAERRDKATPDLAAEFRAGHETSIRAIREVPDELMARDIGSDVGITSLAKILYLTAAEHDTTHLDDIERALGS